MKLAPFHLAFPVTDLTAARHFYTKALHCDVGRSTEHWIDFNFYGHQITAHLVETMPVDATNQVDGKAVPVRHFGLILEWSDWHRVRDNLQAQAVDFLIEPHIRFEHQPGEQASLFITDPSGNGLEFKAFRNSDAVFTPH